MARVIVNSSLKDLATALSPKMLGEFKDRTGALLVEDLVAGIDSGDPRWAALKPKTVVRKGHGEQWRETGNLRSSIKFVSEETKVRVGILGGEKYALGAEVAVAALAQEFGTSTIPARPLFRPTFNDNIEAIKKDAEEEIWNIVTKWGL